MMHSWQSDSVKRTGKIETYSIETVPQTGKIFRGHLSFSSRQHKPQLQNCKQAKDPLHRSVSLHNGKKNIFK